MSLFCGLIAWIAIGDFAFKHRGVGDLVVGIIAAAACAACARTAVRRAVRFSLNEAGFTLGDGRRFVPWKDIEHIRLAFHGDEHNLILKLAPGTSPQRKKFIATNATNPSELDIALDHAATHWQDIVKAVETASGRTIATVTEGPFRLRSRPTTRQ